jgi:hypothetical protein
MTDQTLMISILNDRLPAGITVASSNLMDSYNRSTRISHWDVRYSSQVDLPDRIVVKTSNHLDSIRREGEFYALAQATKCCNVLPSFVGWTATSSEAALAMKDMTPDFNPLTNKPSMAPSASDNKAVFYALGKIHNAFLGYPGIEGFSVDHLSDLLAERMVMNREIILKSLGSRSDSVSLISLFSRLIVCLPSLLRERFSYAGVVTIIHGDFHPGNILVSRQDDPLRILIIDWPNWQPGFPTDDLAYYLTLCFSPGDRNAQEAGLLHLYYEKLLEGLRSQYTWESFQFDYRISILRSMAVAFLWLACDTPPYWAWQSLDFVLDAFHTWECDSLLEG